VAIDIRAIFDLCDREEEKVIWNHLLTISAVLNPLGKAKQILKEMTSTKKKAGGGGDADNFLKNIMDKIGSEVENCDANTNPMQMIGNLLSSGAMNDIFQSISSGINEGNLDLGSMMNTMQSLVGNLGPMAAETVATEEEPKTPLPPLPENPPEDD
jgi:hypothetical protein